MLTITRPTTVSTRDRFARLPEADRLAVKALAKHAADLGAETASQAWTMAFDKFTADSAAKAKKVVGCSPAKGYQREVGHRLVAMRAQHASCSCGVNYEAAGSVAQRAAHAAHKASL